MSWAERNWKSMPLMAEETGSEGFMVNMCGARCTRVQRLVEAFGAKLQLFWMCLQLAGQFFGSPKSCAGVVPTLPSR